MVTRGAMLLVVKVLAALATLALSTLVLYWAWRHLFNITVSAWLSLVMGLGATVALVLNFDRFTSAPALSTPRSATPAHRPAKHAPPQRGSRGERP